MGHTMCIGALNSLVGGTLDDRAQTKEMTMDQSGGDHLMIMAHVYAFSWKHL